MGAEEDRHWVGGTARYQYGDFSFLPSLILYLADADAGDTESFILDVRAKYVTGPLSLEGRLVYTPGDSNGNDRSYDVIGNWAVPGAVEGFALFGNSYGRTDLGPLSFGHTIQQNIRYDTYGLMHAMAKADYTLTPQTTLSVALGLFNAAEETSGIADGIPDAGTDLRNITYAGGSHIATEIDAWLKYQLYSNAHVLFWAAYAMTGDALDLMMDGKTYESQDVLGAGAQIAYTF